MDVHTDYLPATPSLDHDLRCGTQAQEHPAYVGVEYTVEIGEGSYRSLMLSS